MAARLTTVIWTAEVDEGEHDGSSQRELILEFLTTPPTVTLATMKIRPDGGTWVRKKKYNGQISVPKNDAGELPPVAKIDRVRLSATSDDMLTLKEMTLLAVDNADAVYWLGYGSVAGLATDKNDYYTFFDASKSGWPKELTMVSSEYPSPLAHPAPPRDSE